ncbi:MAG: hypothetical protein SGI74_09110 [Oligoflexia bacterium]|nr:hypothetical protein [Oligoflexia bacterium]
MHTLKPSEKYFQILLAILGFLVASLILAKHIYSAPFIDETYVIGSAKNFILEGNYATPEFPVFSSLISTGFWSSYPSGIAAALGADKPTIRTTFFYFCCFMLLLCLRMALGHFQLSKLEKNTWPFIFLGIFLNYIPYPESTVMSLGEIPACAYLFLSLLFLYKNNISVGFCLLGVSVFGGKMVNMAFALPLLTLYTFNIQKKSLTERLKPLLCFLIPFFIWDTIIAFCAGPQVAARWVFDFFGNLESFSKLAIGKGFTPADVPRQTLLSRFSNPDLEWVHYPLLLQLKIIFLLGVPTAISFWVYRNEIKTMGLFKWCFHRPLISALLVGQWIFAFWYFGVHPQMWIRHVQPALVIGIALLGMYAWQYYLKNKKPLLTRYVQILIFAFFSLRIIQFIIKAGAN